MGSAGLPASALPRRALLPRRHAPLRRGPARPAATRLRPNAAAAGRDDRGRDADPAAGALEGRDRARAGAGEGARVAADSLRRAGGVRSGRRAGAGWSGGAGRARLARGGEGPRPRGARDAARAAPAGASTADARRRCEPPASGSRSPPKRSTIRAARSRRSRRRWRRVSRATPRCGRSPSTPPRSTASTIGSAASRSGKIANLLVTAGELFTEGARLDRVVVDGRIFAIGSEDGGSEERETASPAGAGEPTVEAADTAGADAPRRAEPAARRARRASQGRSGRQTAP